MATYLPNVKDYIPKTETFTPDYKFLNDVLSIRQDRYDSNYKAMNNMYGQVVHADVSREDSKAIRDQYTEHLIPKMKQIAGLDLSLQENVNAAKGLFAPFYENKELVRDIVATKAYKTSMTGANNLKNHSEEEFRRQYWEGGIKRMQYEMEDFIDAPRDKMMNMKMPSFVKQYDIETEGLKKIKELDPDIERTTFSKDKYWKIIKKNGSLLRAQATGQVDKEGKDIMTDPVGDYLSSILLKDPRAIEYYQTMAYVEARTFYDNNKDKYTTKEQGMDAWGDNFLSQFTEKEEVKSKEIEAKLFDAESRKKAWDNYVAKHGYVPGDKTDQEMNNTQAEIDAYNVINETRIADARAAKTGPSDNLTKAFKMYMGIKIASDINDVANSYASTHGSVEVELSELKKLEIQHKYRMIEAEYKENRADVRKQAELNAEYGTQNYGYIPEETRLGDKTNLNPGEQISDMTADNNYIANKELSKDADLKFNMVRDWFVQSNSDQEKDIKSVDYDAWSGVTKGNTTSANITWDKLEEKVGNGDTEILDILYDKLKVDYKKALGKKNAPVSTTLMISTGKNIEFLKERMLTHIDGNEKMNAQYKRAADIILTSEKGENYRELVEEHGVSVFKDAQGGKTIVSEEAFIKNYVASQSFEPYFDNNEKTTSGHSNGIRVSSKRVRTQPKKLHAIDTYGDYGINVTFDVEGATEKGKEVYDKLIYEVNQIAEDSDGTNKSMPGFSLRAYYAGEDQRGTGVSYTNWVGGTYDIANMHSNNAGARTWEDFTKARLDAAGSDMVIKFGKADGTLTDVIDDKFAAEMIDMLIQKGQYNSKSERSKDNRQRFSIWYNEHGATLNSENLDDDKAYVDGYSVYEITVDPNMGLGDMANVKAYKGAKNTTNNFQEKGGVISVYVPKHKYQNHADDGERQHPWSMMLNRGASPKVEILNGGKVEYQKVGNDYYQSLTLKSFDGANGYVDAPTLQTKLPSGMKFNNYEKLMIDINEYLLNNSIINDKLEKAYIAKNKKKK